MMHVLYCVVFFATPCPWAPVRTAQRECSPVCLRLDCPANSVTPRTRTGECGFKPPELAPVQEQCSPARSVQVQLLWSSDRACCVAKRFVAAASLPQSRPSREAAGGP